MGRGSALGEALASVDRSATGRLTRGGRFVFEIGEVAAVHEFWGRCASRIWKGREARSAVLGGAKVYPALGEKFMWSKSGGNQMSNPVDPSQLPVKAAEL